MATYWQTRAIEEEARQHELTKEEMKKIEEIYDETIMNLDKDVNYWLTKFANVEGISLADAKEKLSKGELDKFKMQLKDYIEAGERLELDGSMINDMKKASSLYHIDRLEAMKIQAKYHVSTLGKRESTTMEEFLKKNYKESYYRGAFDIQQGAGFGSKIYALNPDLVESVVKKPWTMDGHNFSSRVWSDKDALLNKLQSTLTQTFIKGDNVTKVAEEFAKHMETSKSNAIRILRTEANASQSKARKSVYEDLDVEEYEIVATLDTRTSKVCQELDGKKFKAKDYEVGVTANPFHPYCRTTTAPFFEDDEDSQRAAKDDGGKTYEVPADMKYEKWKDKQVVDKEENIANTRKTNNPVNTKNLLPMDELSDNWYKGLNGKEKEEIFTYTKGDTPNAILRGNTDHVPEEYLPYVLEETKATTDVLDGAIDKFNLDRDVKVYRTVNADFYREFGISLEDIYSDSKYWGDENGKVDAYYDIFKEYTEKGYVSTSLNIDEPFRLNPEAHTLFEIDVPAGSRGVYIGNNSAVKGQKEFLLARDTKFSVYEVKAEPVKYIDDYGIEQTQHVIRVKAKVVSKEINKAVGKLEKVGYNEVIKEIESFEKSILKDKFESAKVITPNGDIFELIGDARNVDPTELGIDLTGAYITHNHPEGLHDFGFSNDDFAFFTANNLKLLRAVDEKYIHELTTDLFEMEFEDIDINDFSNYQLIKQLEKSKSTGLRYRRLLNDKR